MEVKFSDYVAYFESIARSHVDIGHTDESKHFFRFELADLLTQVRTKMKFPALVLEGYDFNFQDSKSDNVMKSRNGAFMLLKKVSDKGDLNAIQKVYDEMEVIGDEILIKMLDDKRNNNNNVVRDFQMDSVQA